MTERTKILNVKNCNFYTFPSDFFKSVLVTANYRETIVDGRLILDDGQFDGREDEELYARAVDLRYLDIFCSSREIEDDRLELIGHSHLGYSYRVKELIK